MLSIDQHAELREGTLLRMRSKRIAPYAIILAAACWFLYLTTKFDYDKLAGSLGPDAWPRLILSLTIVACVFEIVRLALFWRGDEHVGYLPTDVASDDALAVGDDVPLDSAASNWRQAGAALASIVGYLLALGYLGFFIATFSFITIFALIAGYRRIAALLLVALGLTTGFMFLFMRVIYVSLPIGIEPFSKVSLLVMKLLGIS